MSEGEANSELDALFVEGVRLFNEKEFFACHEVLEALWIKQDGAPKRFTQGVIQIAVAYHHLGRNNPGGAKRLFERALAKLDDDAISCRLGRAMNIDEFLEQITAQTNRLEQGWNAGSDPLPVPVITLR